MGELTLTAIQVLLFMTLVMICESKTLKNNIFLEMQCTQVCAQGYSRAIHAVLGQNTPVLLSFRQQSSEQGIGPPARPPKLKKNLHGLSNTATLSQAFPGKSICSTVKGICVLI